MILHRALLLSVAAVAFPMALLAQRPGGAAPGPLQQEPPRATSREAPRGTAILRGFVVAADTGTPIRRAQVRVTGQGASRLATTDAQGRFEIKELAAGRYSISASKGGFVSLQYGQRRPSESGTPLDLGDGEVLEKLVIGLPRGSVISGRITDEFGEPVANAVISAMRYGYAAGARRLLPAGGQNSRDTTDDQGAFRLFGLSPGDYVVSAAYRAGGGEVTDPADDEHTGYAPTYYPGTPDVAEAQRVSVGIGQEQTGVIFSLIATRLVRVSGTVLSSQGTAMTGGIVIMTPAGSRLGGGARMQTMSGRVDPSGQFRIANVPPGRYVIQARSGGRGAGGRGAAAGINEFGRQEISVGSEDFDGVVIVTSPGARVTGRILTDTSMTPSFEPRQLSVAARLAAPDQSTPGGGGGSTRINPDWTFEISGLFDARVFRVNAPQGWELKSVTLNGQEITDIPVELPPGQSVQGLEIVITEKTTEISGRVSDTRGAAVTDATIVIFPADDARWTYQSRFIRATRPDQDGRFEVRGLPPAEAYLAIPVQGLENGQAGDPDFLATVRDAARRFSLGEGEARVLDLHFDPR